VKTEGKRKVTFNLFGQKWEMYILLYGLKNIEVDEYPSTLGALNRTAIAYGRTVGAG
jgi:hypothetical protein